MDLALQREMWVVIIDMGAISVLNVRGLDEITKAKYVGREKQTTLRQSFGENWNSVGKWG